MLVLARAQLKGRIAGNFEVLVNSDVGGQASEYAGGGSRSQEGRKGGNGGELHGAIC